MRGTLPPQAVRHFRVRAEIRKGSLAKRGQTRLRERERIRVVVTLDLIGIYSVGEIREIPEGRILAAAEAREW